MRRMSALWRHLFVEDGVLSFNGQRVRFFMPWTRRRMRASALWTDARPEPQTWWCSGDASGQITGVESISDEKAQEYLIATQPQIDLDGLEEKLETKMRDYTQTALNKSEVIWLSGTSPYRKKPRRWVLLPSARLIYQVDFVRRRYWDKGVTSFTEVFYKHI